MAKKSDNEDKALEERLEQLIQVSQDLFILHALQAGISNSDVRKMARVNTDRVTNISKYLNRAK